MRRIILLLLMFVVSTSALAELYRWVDEDGVTHFGDRVPPEDARHGRDVLNKEGRTIKSIDRALTPEELAEYKRQQKLQQERERRERERREKDRILLLTYQSVEEIESARDEKIETVENAIQISRSRRQNQEKKLQTLRTKAANYERNSRVVPKALTEQIDHMHNNIADIDAYIDRREREKQTIRDEFAGYIDRYRELTSKAN